MLHSRTLSFIHPICNSWYLLPPNSFYLCRSIQHVFDDSALTGDNSRGLLLQRWHHRFVELIVLHLLGVALSDHDVPDRFLIYNIMILKKKKRLNSELGNAVWLELYLLAYFFLHSFDYMFCLFHVLTDDPEEWFFAAFLTVTCSK